MQPEANERNQAGQDQSDDPRRADESGEPAVAGRSHGRVIDDETHAPSGAGDAASQAGDSKDWESGRHQSM